MPNPIHDERYAVFRSMLVEARLSQSLLQAQVAARLAKPQSFISKYERGERRLDFPEFLAVADALGIAVDEFIRTYRDRIKNI